MNPRLTRILRTAVVLVTTGAAAALPLVAFSAPAQAEQDLLAGRAALGVYRGAPPDMPSKLASFETLLGASPTVALDFTPNSWDGIVGQSWQLGAWAKQPQRLEYTISMLPNDTSTSLEACAAGSYNSYWRTLSNNLMSYGLGASIIRPGHEFNGTWYRWSAANRPAAYASCFRNIVTTMRAVPGQSFLFDWSPNIGPGALPAELAYPGDAYVDVIGIDAYDQSWAPGTYPYAAGATADQRLEAQKKSWSVIKDGDHGLVFWRNFAQAHGKRLAIPEWGLTTRPDGHGGGDDPYYIEQMAAFIKDPANLVAWQNYFDFDAPDGSHRISGATAFPLGAKAYQAAFTTPTSSPTTTTTPTSTTTTTATTAPTTSTTTAPTTTSTSTATGGSSAPAPVSPQLWVSSSATRSGALPLSGQKLTSTAYIFVTGGPDVSSVAFRLDDPTALRAPYRTEWGAPWDMGATAAGDLALPMDLSKLSNGSHTVTALVTQGGSTTRLAGSFTTNRKGIVAKLAGSNVILADHVLSSPTNINVTSATPLRKVVYSVDDTVVGTSRGRTLYDPRRLKPGRHTMTARTYSSSRVQTVRTTFRTRQAGRAGTVSFSTSGGKAPTTALSGHTVSGKVYVGLKGGTGVQWVRFSVDGWTVRKDLSRPFQLLGSSRGRALALDTHTMKPGRHTVTAWVQTSRGVNLTTTSFFVRR